MRSDGALVVGGGLLGLAAAYKMLLARPGAPLTLLEKERGLGRHQSGHNSGVLHAGVFYRPGSAKARLAVSGIRQLTEFCRLHDVRHEICGKLVAATAERELPALRELQERGERNGLRGLAWLEADRIREREPHVRAVAALLVPEEGIVDYAGVVAALAREVTRLGGRVVTGAEVRGLRRERGAWIAETPAGVFRGSPLLGCAGLQADRLAALAGARPPLRIVPFRGEYYRLRGGRRHLVRHLVYPLPDPAFPFLGVHLTRTVAGEVEVGPNAALAMSREGYRRGSWNARDVASAVSFPGLWRFLRRHPRLVLAEARRSLSRRAFCDAARRLVPELEEEDLEPLGAGIRAQAMLSSGELPLDFAFHEAAGALHVLNAPSPAATACLAIGDEIVARLEGARPGAHR